MKFFALKTDENVVDEVKGQITLKKDQILIGLFCLDFII